MPAESPAETDASLRALDEDLQRLQAELEEELLLGEASLEVPATSDAPVSTPGAYEAKLRVQIEAELRAQAR